MYKPSLSPISSVDEITVRINEELYRIAESLSADTSRAFLILDKLTVEPNKLFDGLIVYADGTEWDPGSGEGIYAYYGAAWNKLG